MDLAVLVILIVLVIIILRDVKWVTYLIGIIEIFLRLIHYIASHLRIDEFSDFVNKYFPNTIFDILAKYSSGIVYDILSWLLVLFFIWFLIYLVNYLFKAK